MQPPKLEVRNVSKSFRRGAAGTLQVLQDICLEVANLEFLALLGPSGCGKSTLLRIIDGLIPCDTGTIHLNGQDIHALHVEHAHTDGDSFLHFRQANVIHTGDLWFNGMYPFIDTESGGSVDGAIVAVEAILAVANADTKIIPGHGPLGDRKALEGYLAFLKDVSGRVRKLIDEGRTLEEVQALKPLADYDATLGKGFFKPENFLGLLYNGLKKQ